MGELLKGIKRNLLNNKKNSFNIGFSNRSPFSPLSYQLPSADPNSGVTPIDPPDMNDGTVERIKAQADATSSMLESFSNLASTAIKEEKKKYSDEDIAKQKLKRKQKKIDNKKTRNYAKAKDIKRKDLTDQDIKNIETWDPQKDTSVSKSKKKRYKNLEDQVNKLDTDIKAGEYSDVSGADLERIAEQKAAAEGKAATALAEWSADPANLATAYANQNKNNPQTNAAYWQSDSGVINRNDGTPCTNFHVATKKKGC